MAAHYVIVGSGIAGLAAAEAIRAQDPPARISMVSEEADPCYSRPGLAYLLRGDFSERQLAIRSKADMDALQLDRLHARVEALDLACHALTLSDGRELHYDRLLLATGALAVTPSFPGGALDGVVKLDSLADTRRILARVRRGRPAVVIGGGITALELAEGLRARGMRVHYFLRGRGYWTDVLDEVESAVVLGRLRHEGVEVHLETQIEEAQGRDGRLCAVRTKAGQIVPCEMLAAAIGVRPRIDLARAAGLQVNRGVLVNHFLQSSDPDVFAAGDTAEVVNPASGQGVLDVLWPVALRQGGAAGANMAGAGAPYQKAFSMNVTMLTELKVTVIGAVGGGKNEDLVAITRGESEAWRAQPQGCVLSEGHDTDRVRLLIGERTILGALVMGAQEWSRPLQRLVAGEVDITAVRPHLLAGGPRALAALGGFYQQWEGAAR